MRVNVRRCILDGQTVISMETFYAELERQLALPRHFGRNLDALWDVLTADVPGPLELVWNRAGLSRAAMGDSFERVVELLRDAAAERGGELKIVVRMG
ncbi:barstar family protein [Geomobilimonas luticola]|uniref:Barstar family protein n=1 Tax=Geomobilimonas luticola TaxID=1114878 RepID=A0ABS5SHA5_9BACT|nr:barstar family protein [Geomobilimonas luticola]MBT0653894.1 barstar family protein [Geomobilimonas luticola]